MTTSGSKFPLNVIATLIIVVVVLLTPTSGRLSSLLIPTNFNLGRPKKGRPLFFHSMNLKCSCNNNLSVRLSGVRY